jgi:type II secretion system protein I
MKLNFPTCGQGAGPIAAKRPRAFSLLEVMIAIAIFFLAVFAILSLVSTTLANARRLHRPQVDASAVLAHYANTNILIEGTYSGNLSDLLGKAYRDYNWTAEIREVETNHLYQVEAIVQVNGNREILSDLSTLFYRPQSPAGSLDGGNFIRR